MNAPLTRDPLAPVPTGDRMTFWVPSEHKASVRYRVDLLANNGAGWCSCVDFGTRRQPAIDRGAGPHTEASLCKHIRRALQYFMRDLCADMARSECETGRNNL